MKAYKEIFLKKNTKIIIKEIDLKKFYKLQRKQLFLEK
jgi:hypothetical protein